MGNSAAISMPTGSPRSLAAARSGSSIRRSSPWRRWVGATVTLVSAALGMTAPPGSVRVEANDRSVPTTRSRSKAAVVRLRSKSGRAKSAQPSTVSWWKPRHMASPQRPSSSSVMARTSVPMAEDATTAEWATPRELHQPPGDHLQTQRLVGALEDRQHAGVHEQPAHGVLLGVAVATVDLERLACHPLGRLAHVGLHHRRLHGALALG